ncbi:MAG: Abi family protein [Verrucomicrobia bacterium]|nr:Abi family protein [Verrucomicrobiota bacterium]
MSKPLKGFNYSEEQISAIEIALSPDRFRTYLLRAGGSRMKAVLVYERNTAISEALYGIMQAVEVCLRNSIHRTLSASRGDFWFDHVTMAPPQLEKLEAAKRQLAKDQRTVTAGAVVAELSLGFWTSLISREYDALLWVPILHKAFPYAEGRKTGADRKEVVTKLSRAEIHDRLEGLRKLRNRIAHHEHILKLDLPRLYAESLEVLGWICPVSAEWIRSTNNFKVRFYEKPTHYSPLTLPKEPKAATPGRPAAIG